MIATALALGGLVWLAWGLFGPGAAMLGALVLLFDPFLAAHGRLIHLDALLASFMALAAVASVAFFGGRPWPYLAAAGLFSGLAFLTKAPSVYLLGFIPGLALLEQARGGAWREGRAWRRLLLGLADRYRGTRREESVGPRDALIIGAAQALALIPGTSRSGITMTAALALGLERSAAARYSFLMSVPITAMAAAHGAVTLVRSPERFAWHEMLLGAAIAAVAGVAVIHLLLGILGRVGTAPFVIYRVALGVLVLALFAMRN